MNCRQAKELLTGNLAMNLTPGENAALNDHLTGCKACRADADTLEVAWRALDSIEVFSPPLHVKAHLFRAIEAERRRENTILSSLRRLLPAPLAAGLVSLGVAFVFPYQWFANLCHSLVGVALGTADWPMEPFFFLAGGLYSSLPVYFTLWWSKNGCTSFYGADAYPAPKKRPKLRLSTEP